MVTCRKCGQENPDGFRFCGGCASPLAEDRRSEHEERKRVSVLFCDLVGFTGRAESLDPEEVRALLRPYHARVRHQLERHGGTVEKFIGDAVVAIFGAPVSHEDDPERAVRAALAIRDTIAGDELHVRIGVTTGEALVAMDARPESGEGIASGDVLNTASRLQAAAPADGVLVDDATHRATRRAIEYRDHPPVDAKGKAQPVVAWEAVAALSRLGLDVGERAPTPLVGRDLELQLLNNALARARGERLPQLVTLVGVPGIGKSRLVLELLRLVDADEELIRWRQGRCLPYGEGVTLWALGEIIKAETGVLETDSVEQASAKLTASVRDAVSDDTDAAWVERHLRPLVGLEPDTELTGERRDEAFAAWRRFLEGVADRSPLVLVVEDLQWADEALLDFVDHLVDWATDVPLLVVATARPELLDRRPGWGGGKPNSTIQSLSPLSDDQTAALAHAILGRAVLPVDVQQSLVANAGGNPLYAEEFARMLTERRAAGGAEPAVPESVQGIIAARLDVLQPAEKSLLQDAAVLGKVFWLSALESLTGEERWRLEQRLHDLERREMVRRDRQSAVAGERQYAFRHLLVREVAYGQIPRSRRAAKHAAAARWIEGLSADRGEDRADMRAYHWSAALDYARTTGQDGLDLAARAGEALAEAGDRALKLNAPAQAAEFYGRALELSVSPELLLRHGRSLYLAGDPRARGTLGRARDELAAAGDIAGEAFAEAMLSHIAWLAGNARDSAEHIGRAVQLVGPLTASEVKAHVLARAGSSAFVGGRLADAVDLAGEALALAEQLELPDLRVHALTTLGTARVDVGDDDGFRDLERAIELGVAANLPEAARAIQNLGVQLFLRGDIAAYRMHNEDAIRHERRLGHSAGERFERGAMPAIEFFVGDWAAADHDADEFIAECEGSPHYLEPLVRSFRALLRLARDDVAGALADTERALAMIEGAQDPQARAAPTGNAVLVFSDLGDPRAVAAASEALDIRLGELQDPIAVSFLPLLELGPDIEAQVRTVLAGSRIPTLWTEAGQAASERRFAEAADVFARMPFRHAEAYARLRAAQELIADGRRIEADEQLRRALSFWRSVGARRYLRRGEELLRATA